MTLVDVAVSLMLIGIIMTPLLYAYTKYRKDQAMNRTSFNLSGIQQAISDFYFQNNRYPCPALITALPDSANYGSEDCAGTNAAANIKVGSVPFKSLKLPASRSLDGWQSRITYVVTSAQTIAPMNPIGGAITVRQRNVTVVPGPPSTLSCLSTLKTWYNANGHVLLISHGPDMSGAYTAAGVQSQACPPGGPGVAPADAENCDYMTNATFLDDYCAAGDSPGSGYYDDIVTTWASAPQKIWTALPTDPVNDIHTKLNVGINSDVPAIEMLEVTGNIKAESDPLDPVNKPGHIHGTNICKADGTGCMAPATIAGAGTLSCSSGAEGVSNNMMKCTGQNPLIITCPHGQTLTSFDPATGNYTCS